MSFAVFDLLKKYAEWRRDFLRHFPEKKLIPDVSVTDKPFISLGEKGKNLGILVLVALGLVLASRSD
ncbi:unnamed protein product [marine sediment metagenome]|uniref:Uncharacterized protein n=1 Tax=marine sediment metagenome TaxID=412755 RepID=X1KK36_9ZZZZ